ncbi:unnamed protein product [Miscanthus lutarioriparius]|uniref:WRKY domain-containing protein n=1 Tax=Miscanthus lutarioriparius TaxID=422564 RepID=A0A811R750_9POAL|nr:unnamed protein product [Miscanthus lutarioriparius]
MENQSAQPQHGMADQGFRPLTTTPLSSSVHAAPVMMQIRAPIQMPVLPSNSADDGYIWKNLGLQEIAGSGRLMICYECSQANCTVKKAVTLSADNQILETVFRGSHNHPCPSEMCPRDVPTGHIPDSQHYSYVPSEMYVPAGTSIPQTEEGGEQEQLGSSSDSDEEDGSAQRDHGHVASASVTERF